MSRSAAAEPILAPEQPIIDAHHHLWVLGEPAYRQMEGAATVASRALLPRLRSQARYLLDDLLVDLNSGHDVRATVFVDAHAMYRATGPESLKSLGEVEFANGIAAVGASATLGPQQVCAGIVGNVDLRLGEPVESILRAHIQAGGGRYRGVRGAAIMAYDEDQSILGTTGIPHLLLDARFREGFQWLERLGLSFDAWLLEPQLPDLIDLARAFPGTTMVLNHLGCPVGTGRYSGQRESRFSIWRNCIQALAKTLNVSVKLGGLGMPMNGLPSFGQGDRAKSEVLADEWRPYVETCIEAFGPDRCMFESNFPVDARTCTYRVLWNAFKRIVMGYSQAEKNAVFFGTAARVYRLDV